MKFLVLTCLLLVSACGTQSKATPYADLTAGEKARIALDARDYPTAITLYNAIITANPEDYESYRFLSAAYAELGGFDLLKAVGGTIGSTGASLLDTLAQFIPAEPTDAQIEALHMATATLLRLPEEQRSNEHPEIPTASSGAQQLQFYQAAYSLIYLNKFTKVTATGSLDPSQLETMTDEDVNNILDNFEAIAAAAGGGVVAEGASEFISQLDSMPGETRRDKLIHYVETHSN